MKKRRIGALLAFCLLALGSAQVRADDLLGQSGWKVTFTQDNQMESNFGRSDMDEAISGMQPGDNITFTLNLESRSDKVTDWYLTNEVVNSLEDRSANANTGGGAYTYYLAYEGSNRQQVLFDSDTVGGEGSDEGLKEATDALEDYVYLDTLSPGQSGVITLKIALDGETQGNHYQDTLADLQMNFAVELRPSSPSGGRGGGGTSGNPGPRHAGKDADCPDGGRDKACALCSGDGCQRAALSGAGCLRRQRGQEAGKEREEGGRMT